MPRAMSELIRPLTSLTAEDAPLVGGKAANLGALNHLEHRVPDGFVITVDAFRQHFAGDLDNRKPLRPIIQVDLIRGVQEALESQFGENLPRDRSSSGRSLEVPSYSIYRVSCLAP